MSRVVVITGGVRSGKSRRALELASPFTPKLFIATATPGDDEMRERIDAHRAERDASWTTVEEPRDVASVLRTHPEGAAVIDCMTLWLANTWSADVTDILAAARTRARLTIFVTNEVGWGIVPEYESGRRFRDLAGAMNQSLAREADEVLLMVAGLELRVK